MTFVMAKCVCCGANIKVNDTEEKEVCKYCGNILDMEEIINHYKVYYNIQKPIVYTTLKRENYKARQYAEAGKRYILTGSPEKSKEAFAEARCLEPDNGEYFFWDEMLREGDLKSYLQIYPIQQEWETEFLKSSLPNYFHQNYFYKCWGRDKIVDIERCKMYYEFYEKSFNGCANSDLFLIRELYGNSYCAWRNIDDILFLIELDCKKEIDPYDKGLYFTYEGPDDAMSIYELACRRKVSTFSSDFDTSKVWRNDVIRDLIEKYYPRNDIPRYIPEKEKASQNGCYIASCIYGSYDCPQVWTLRRFRDYTLDKTRCGRLFIKCYYIISPALVKWFGETKWFKRFWKSRLDKLVFALNVKGVDNTYYHDKY